MMEGCGIDIPALSFVPPHSSFPEMTIANTTSPGHRAIHSPHMEGYETVAPRVGNYQIIRKLSPGNSGDIFEGVNVRTLQPVAIKVLEKTPKHYCAAALEADVSSALDHKYCIKYIDKVENQDYVFLVMDFAQNGDLFSYSFDREEVTSLTESTALIFFTQLVLGLEHIHSRGIVHADIKLENIFLNEKVDVVIGDFGLSRYFSPHKTAVYQHGTVHYSAPETFLGEPVVGPEVDVWSAGVVLYCMLHGRFPFFGETDTDLIVNICTTKPIVDRSITPATRALLRGCLKRSADKRLTIDAILTLPSIRPIVAQLTVFGGEDDFSSSLGFSEDEDEMEEVRRTSTSRKASTSMGLDIYIEKMTPRRRSLSSPSESPRAHSMSSPRPARYRLPSPMSSPRKRAPSSPRVRMPLSSPRMMAPRLPTLLRSPLSSPREISLSPSVSSASPGPSRSPGLSRSPVFGSPPLRSPKPRRTPSLRRQSLVLKHLPNARLPASPLSSRRHSISVSNIVDSIAYNSEMTVEPFRGAVPKPEGKRRRRPRSTLGAHRFVSAWQVAVDDAEAGGRTRPPATPPRNIP